MTHGTYRAYVVDHWRCDECRRANREYERNRTRREAYGKSFFVPAEPVRQRVRDLMALGMSQDEIARAAGLNDCRLSDLMTGHWRTKRPLTRMKRENAEAIMSVRQRKPLPGTVVDVPKVRGMVLDLMALGYTPPWIARQIGRSYQGRADLMRATHQAGTVAALLRLHGSVVTMAPLTPESARARNFALAQLGRTGRRKAS